MRKFWNNHKGVTMVEVLVTVAILAIVVAPCLSAFVMAQRGNVKAAEAQAAYTAAANLMEELKGTDFDTLAGINTKYIKEGNVTAFCQLTDDTYYTVTIYVGKHENAPTDVEPLLKGVIAP